MPRLFFIFVLLFVNSCGGPTVSEAQDVNCFRKSPIKDKYLNQSKGRIEYVDFVDSLGGDIRPNPIAGTSENGREIIAYIEENIDQPFIKHVKAFQIKFGCLGRESDELLAEELFLESALDGEWNAALWAIGAKEDLTDKEFLESISRTFSDSEYEVGKSIHYLAKALIMVSEPRALETMTSDKFSEFCLTIKKSHSLFPSNKNTLGFMMLCHSDRRFVRDVNLAYSYLWAMKLLGNEAQDEDIRKLETILSDEQVQRNRKLAYELADIDP